MNNNQQLGNFQSGYQETEMAMQNIQQKDGTVHTGRVTVQLHGAVATTAGFLTLAVPAPVAL